MMNRDPESYKPGYTMMMIEIDLMKSDDRSKRLKIWRLLTWPLSRIKLIGLTTQTAFDRMDIQSTENWYENNHS